MYHQSTTQDGDKVDENSLFVTNLIPLRLYQSDDPTKIFWKNPVPNSTRYCRQIRFEYKNETEQASIEEKQLVEAEIENLYPFQEDLPSGRVEVNFKMVFTMVDGKVQSSVTRTRSAATCPICGAIPKEMNNIQVLLGKYNDEEALLMGITPLHMYIRCFEMFLHIGIRTILPQPS